MATLHFAKYHGAGNDYILVNTVGRAELLDELPRVARALCRPHFGVGADGVIALDRPRGWRMHMWNADGSRGSVCGNGLRCAALFLRDEGLELAESFEVESDVAQHELTHVDAGADSDRHVRIDIGRAVVESEDDELRLEDSRWVFIKGSVGNAHAVVFVAADLDTIDVTRVGSAFQRCERFEGGVNVEFVQPVDAQTLRQRTFERGSGETLACGSGATVAVAAARSRGIVVGESVRVMLRGGELRITHRGDDLYDLTGPATRVFAGFLTLPDRCT